MSDLSSTTSIGGISVELRGDTGPLKADAAAGIAAVKATVAANPIVARISLDASALHAQVASMKQAMQAMGVMMSGGGASAGTFRPMAPQINTSQFDGQLARLKTSFIQTVNQMRSAADSPMQVTVQRTGGTGHTVNIPGGNNWQANAPGGGQGGGENWNWNPGQGGGGQGGGGQGGGGQGGGGQGGQTWVKGGYGRLLSVMGAARGYMALANDLNERRVQSNDFERTMKYGSGDEQTAAMKADTKANYDKDNRNLLSYGTSRLATWTGLQQDTTAAMDTLGEASKVDQKTAKMAKINEFVAKIHDQNPGVGLTARTTDVDEIEKQRQAVAFRMEEFKKLEARPESLTKLNKLTPEMVERKKNEEEIYKKDNIRIDREEKLLNNKVFASEKVASLELKASQLAGDYDKSNSIAASRAAGRAGLVASQQDAAGNELNPLRRGVMQKAQALELAKYDQDTDNEKIAREKETGHAINRLKIESVATGLRVHKEAYRAEIYEFVQGSKEKIAKMKENGATNSELEQQAVTDADKAHEMQADHTERMQVKAISLSGGMQSSAMRIGRNFFKAQLNDLDTDTFAKMRGAQEEDKAGILANNFSRRAELTADHDFNIGQATATLDARKKSAQIRSGTGSPQAVLDEQAGVVTQTQSMMNEIAAADPELKEKMKATFVSELKEHKASLDKTMGGGKATTMRSYLETNALMNPDYKDPVRRELDSSINKVQNAGVTPGDTAIVKAIQELATGISSASGLGPLMGK